MIRGAAVAAIACATGAQAFAPSVGIGGPGLAKRAHTSPQSASLAGRPAILSRGTHARGCGCGSCAATGRDSCPLTGLSMVAMAPTEGREAGRRLLASLKKEEVTELFKTFDVDNTGLLCEKELRAAIRSKGVNMTENEFMLFIRDLDENVDGYICEQDFQDAVENIKIRLGAQTTLDPVKGTTTVFRSASDSILKRVAKDTDAWRESSRRYKRTVFEAKDWVKYRRSTRLLDTFLSTFDSGVIRALWFDILVIVGVTSSLLLWNHGVEDQWFINAVKGMDLGESKAAIEGIVAGLPALKLPLSPFTLSAPSLGLLLVFRTNGAFQRFFEARALWGALINDSRTQVRRGLYYLEDPKDIEENARRTIAFARALKLHLRYDADKDQVAYKEFRDLLGKEEAEKLLSATHRPCQAMADCTNFIRSRKLDPLAMQNFDKSFEQQSNIMGACERIFKTPLPLVYTRHTARFLTLWCLLLPFGLYNDMKGSFMLIPVMAVITAFKLGIEELGVQITEPFSILPLENMCDGIENSCTEMVRRNTDKCIKGEVSYAGADAKKLL